MTSTSNIISYTLKELEELIDTTSLGQIEQRTIELVDKLEEYLIEHRPMKINPEKQLNFLEKFSDTLPEINLILLDYFLRTDESMATRFLDDILSVEFFDPEKKMFERKNTIPYKKLIVDGLNIKDMVNNIPPLIKSKVKNDINRNKYYRNLTTYYNNYKVLNFLLSSEDVTSLDIFFKQNYDLFCELDSYFYFLQLKFETYVKSNNVDEIFKITQGDLKEFISGRSTDELKIFSRIIIESEKESPIDFTKFRKAIKISFAKIFKIPVECPLSDILEISDLSFNSLVDICRMYSEGEIISRENDIISRVEIPSKYIKHTIFICPIQKELCLENNPPALLLCGHVISKEAADSISTSGGSIRGIGNNGIKCPYCHVETMGSKIRILKLN